MPSDYIGFRQALLELARVSRTSWEGVDEGLVESLGLLLHDDRLDKLLPEIADKLEIPFPEHRHSFFLLPPIPGRPSLRCVLAMKWTFDDDPGGRGCLRVYMFSGREDDGRIIPFVFRFDDCEKADSWAFAHAQVSDLLAPYEKVFQPFPHRLPSELPRIPLACVEASPATVLVVLLAALYGTKSDVLGSVVKRTLDGRAMRLLKTLSP